MEPQKVTTFKGKFPKFRIWDADKKKFYYSGDTLVIRQEEQSLVVPFAIPVDYKVKDDFIITITEFTGILDSTPKLRPIYTGDIVVTSRDGVNPIEKKTVKWITQIASFNTSFDLVNGLKLVIVGNVFENSEEERRPLLDLSGNIKKALEDTKKLTN